jgi:hypothetical protein
MPTRKKTSRKSPAKKSSAKVVSAKVAPKPAPKKSMVAPLSLAFAAVFIVGLAYIGCINARKNDRPTMLFTQQALTGSFRPAAASGTYLLTFIGVKPHTIVFTDKPQRIVGSWTNTDFVARWNQGATGFAQNPPQAVLMSHSPVDGKEYSVVVELKNPVFNAFAGTLTYSATIADKNHRYDLTPSAERNMDAFPEILRSPALVIDGGSKAK